MRSTPILAFVACLVVGLALLAGCGGGSGGSTGFPAPTTNVTVTATGGGTLTVGAASLSVPPNAVTQTTIVTGQATSTYPADSRVVVGTAYRFEPAALTLLLPAQLTISYGAATLPTGADPNSLQLFQVIGNAWTPVVGSAVNTTTKTVTASVSTLGTFAILATSITGGGGGGTGTNALLFSSDRLLPTTLSNLYTLQTDGTGLKQLTNAGRFEYIDTAFYKPDGTQIVVGFQTGGGSNIARVNSDGSNAITLYGSNNRPDGLPARSRLPQYSLDGSLIAFASDITGVEQIYAMNADGSGVKALTAFTSGASGTVRSVAFTKTGQIAFVVTSGTTTQSYLVGSDGSNFTPKNAGDLSLAPWWSFAPFGASRTYVQSGGSGFDVYTSSADGTGARKITSLNAVSMGHSRYAADGKTIVFDAAGSDGKAEVYKVNADGTGLTNLTNNAGADDRFQDVH